MQQLTMSVSLTKLNNNKLILRSNLRTLVYTCTKRVASDVEIDRNR